MKRVDGIWRRPSLLGGTLSLIVLALLAGPGIQADPIIEIEAEEYVDSHDIGGYEIQVVECTSASGGYAADGIDTVGEWIELLVTLPKAGCYEIAAAFQGYPGQENEFTASLPDAGGESAVLGFVGGGIGCDFDYVWDEGHLPLCVDAAGDHVLRFALSGGGRSRVDIARLTFAGTPVEAKTWSLLKSLYR